VLCTQAYLHAVCPLARERAAGALHPSLPARRLSRRLARALSGVTVESCGIESRGFFVSAGAALGYSITRRAEGLASQPGQDAAVR